MRSVLVLFLFMLCACSSNPLPLSAREQLTIQTTSGASPSFEVEVARTSKELWTGLRWRREMDADHGMLFDLGTIAIARFTMSDTLIPLDMLFLDGAGRILKIAARTVPGEPGPYTSDVPVRAVLELNAGTAARLGIQVGDSVRHKMFARPN
jgi:hypothetical protein